MPHGKLSKNKIGMDYPSIGESSAMAELGLFIKYNHILASAL